MKKALFRSDFIQFSLLVLADLQAEYPEFFECFIAFSHIAEKIYEDIQICGLPEYWHLYMDLFFKG